MSEIKVQCIDQAISFLNTPVISSGNVNYDTISFDFCSRWDGYAKTAIFYRNKDEVYYQLLENDKCIIPNEVLGEKGVIYLGVFGTQGDKTITSQVLTYRIQEGAVTEDLKPADPTPDIYAQIISRYNHYDERLAYFEDRFNSSVGDAEKLGGQMPDYYATAESVRNIQTTSRATLSTAGWYRVAEIPSTTGTTIVDIALGNRYSDGGREFCVLRYDTNNRFKILSSSIRDNITFTKIRLTGNGKNSYIEVYYNFNVSNSCEVSINTLIAIDSGTAKYAWKSLNFIPTSETVDGVTVTTTYDIPENASPVTDLDLVQFKGTKRLTTSILDFALTVPNDETYNVTLSGSNYTGTDLPHGMYKYSTATITGYNNQKVVIIWGMNSYFPVFNCYNTGTKSWDGWQTFATTADLVNYMPKSGGLFTGAEAGIGAYNSTSAYTWSMRNQNRYITTQVFESGHYRVYDQKNNKIILESTVDGTNTFNGTATGNLPLSGGGTVTTDGQTPVSLESTNANNEIVLLKFKKNGVDYGSIGVNGENMPVFRLSNNGAFKELLHTGNVGSYALPIDGGEISSSSYYPLRINNNANEHCMVSYKGKGSVYGFLGFSGLNKPIYGDSQGILKDLHHDGNSAKVTITNSESDVPSEMSGLWAY